MKHIFYIHSNITSVCSYETIKKLQDSGEEVIIILTRSTKWPYDNNNLCIIDFSLLLSFYFSKLPKIRSIKDVVMSKILKKRIVEIIKKITNNDEYLMYIPQYHIGIVSFFCDYKQCKAYYYIEEGVGAYLPKEEVKLLYSPTFRVFSILFGVPYHYLFHINKKFKGVIAINDQAFPWYKGHKIINNVCTKLSGDDDYSMRKNIIILPPLTIDNEELKELILFIYNHLSYNSNIPIAVKFHPKSSTREKEAFSEIQELVKELNIEILPNHFVVEFSIFDANSIIYSLQEKSSLLLYAYIAGVESYWVYKSNKITNVKKVNSIQELLTITYL